MIKQILGDVTVRDNGNGYTAIHIGKSGTSTSSAASAMDNLLSRIYGKGKFYYRRISIKWRTGLKPIEIYHAVRDDEKEEADL